MILVEVAVAAPLASTLTYSLSFEEVEKEQFSIDDYIGRRVLVPLGGRIITGYILGLQEPKDFSYKIKSIYEVVDTSPLFHSNIVPFYRWIATYYLFPLGEVIATALPAGLKRSSSKILSLETTGEELLTLALEHTKEHPDWLNEIIQKKQLGSAAVKKIYSNKNDKKLASYLEKKGAIARVNTLGSEQVKRKEEICYSSSISFIEPETIFPGEDINRDSLKMFWRNNEQKMQESFKFSEIKALYYYSIISKNSTTIAPAKELLANYKGSRKPLSDLCKRGILQKTSKRVYRNPLGDVPDSYSMPEFLTVEQKNAVDEISNVINSNSFSAFLLFGVTGGGKTEVYLRAAANCLKQGRDVLVLVPEIALASMLEAHFLSRFPGNVALLHSGLSKGERFDQWSLAAQGKAKIVIGARSAVFAPLKNIGLIIVDEEHDTGFKQDDSLKYNGRDLAILRGKLQECCVVLGSATPSVTSFYHAQNKKYKLLKIENRVGDSSLPDVEIIDLNKRKDKKKSELFHEKFMAQLHQNLQKDEQSLVLINRRGFSASYLCQDCGTSVLCRHCNVSLTYHKHNNLLKCHYCGYSVNSKIICDNCHSDKLIPFGVGTERIEELLQEKFPDAVIQRLDSDIAADRKRFHSILRKMKSSEIDILIGTQMIAKGHHFPNVTFVGVVWADGGLNMPDFRAAEKTYQLLSQVTGRAGRGEKKGRVIIQTMRPQHYAIEYARSHSYELFFEKEIGIRSRPAFPPFVRLIRLKVSSDNEYSVRKTAEKLATLCKHYSNEHHNAIEVLGPATAPLEKINNLYRWQVMLKSADLKQLNGAALHIQQNAARIKVGGADFSIDVDPENMM